ncbi:MAG: bifunctional 4-hydroxy-2-oxoglutarate aldolase/2-dehydro-3-deoxy-phosphogluconate aldolase [Halanaerobiaceae bacterium]|jgi:2-dehydro-3-deoxyphosphogluconate aldolase/(4S)-4-hydroxy-2-oxoglutarate aldolase|nr:bifunctional 4-hydroxy-2-oxoglutarate aldolase/2-dehydro-3-deoxy-phosphogluconate aldolase [Halanaerobiaceae bacterium]
MKSIQEKIIDNKIIAIIRGIEGNKIIDTVKALIDGGIELLEIALNQSDYDKQLDDIESIRSVKKEFGEKVYLGAGTVITKEQVERVVEAGADYIISPNTNIDVIKKTRELNKVSIPGAFTPSEIIKAHCAGANFIKVFPASSLGVSYIESILNVFNDIPLIAVGGIDISNMNDFINAGAVGVGVGSSLLDRQAIYEGNFDILSKKAGEFLNILLCKNGDV